MGNRHFLAPSILSADVLKLEEQVAIVEANGADFIHVDVMDGHFVPNITFGPFMVKALSQITKLPLDVHLMIEKPERYIEQFIEAGANIVTVHQEACIHLHRTLQLIHSLGAKAGISINPATPLEMIRPVLEAADLVLIMTVNPGFGGQKFIEAVLPKIKKLAEIKRANDDSFLIEVDGGINTSTARRVMDKGAEALVAGNAIFAQTDIAAATRQLKEITGK